MILLQIIKILVILIIIYLILQKYFYINKEFYMQINPMTKDYYLNSFIFFYKNIYILYFYNMSIFFFLFHNMIELKLSFLQVYYQNILSYLIIGKITNKI